MTRFAPFSNQETMEDTRKCLFVAAVETVYEQEHTAAGKDADALSLARNYRYQKALELMTFHRWTVDDLLEAQQNAIAALEGHE